MNPGDIESLIQEWTELGFEPMDEINGERVWKDCCVVESMFGGATLPCDWLEIGDDGRTATLMGTDPGPIVGRTRKRGAQVSE